MSHRPFPRIDHNGHQMVRPNQNTDFWFADNLEQWTQGKQRNYNQNYRLQGRLKMKELRNKKKS